MVDRHVPTLYIFSGLPGVGKSTFAKMLATHARACYLRIDTLEQALRDLCGVSVIDEGYRLAYLIARENLQAGSSVVADSCNPIAVTRRDWADVAKGVNARYQNIEIICSDPEEHQRRIQGRHSEVQGLKLPTWNDVIKRDYESWPEGRITVDTAGKPINICFQDLLHGLEGEVT